MSKWLSFHAYRYQGGETVLNQLWAGLTLKWEGKKLISAATEHKFLVAWSWISFWLRDVPAASSHFQVREPTDHPGAGWTPARQETHNPTAGRDMGNKFIFAKWVKRPALD